jgi:hypothetical protein
MTSLNEPAARERSARALGRPSLPWRVTAWGVAGLFVVGSGLHLGHAQNAPGKTPAAVPSPPPTTFVELLVPAGVKVAIEGEKLTHNSKTGEVVAEGEAMVRLPRHVLLKSHLARVTVAKQVPHRATRVLVEPMPRTVAQR